MTQDKTTPQNTRVRFPWFALLALIVAAWLLVRADMVTAPATRPAPHSIAAAPPVSTRRPPAETTAARPRQQDPVTSWNEVQKDLARKNLSMPVTILATSVWWSGRAQERVVMTGTTTRGRLFATQTPSMDRVRLLTMLMASGIDRWHARMLLQNHRGIDWSHWGAWLLVIAAAGMLLRFGVGGWRGRRHDKAGAADASGSPYTPLRASPLLAGMRADVIVLSANQNVTRFADVAGCEEARAEVQEVVEFLREPERFARVNARMPKGVLMSGPPGTGKTLMAKAVAGEAGVPCLITSGSAFVEMLVGVGAARVRELFARARAMAPCIVFIDEIDALARRRSDGDMSDSESDRTLNQMLVEMDGFRSSDRIVVLAATNRPDTLDEALTRPGRFDRTIGLTLPDRAGRARILGIHGAVIPVAATVRWDDVAKTTPGFSGADLANLVNEAAIVAARRAALVVSEQDITTARDRIMLGLAHRRSTSDRERRITAYHEAGHALVAHTLAPAADPVHAVTILPRAHSLGMTVFLPDDDVQGYEYNGLLARLAVMMGGRAAERIGMNTLTTGAADDLSRATVLARRMVDTWGMTAEMGMVSMNVPSASGGVRGPWSEATRQTCDAAVRRLLEEADAHATSILEGQSIALEAVATALLAEETLPRGRFLDVLATVAAPHA